MPTPVLTAAYSADDMPTFFMPTQQESQRIHKAFKEAMAHQAAATAAGLGPGGALRASAALGSSAAGVYNK
jgi:hypothetical protein